MSQHPLSVVIQHIRQLVAAPPARDDGDAGLLERFAANRDEAAFEALLQRHGPMVLNLCRGMLRDRHAADDAFQATFLVLARKAASIRKQHSVADWLSGVAYRIALKARAGSDRRRQHERQAAAMPSPEPACDLDQQELYAVLHEELQRLPEKYRTPLVLHYLEGRTFENTARELGCPSGSMWKRLARGRDLLRERLAFRGVALSAAGLTAILTENATAALPPALLTSTLQAVTLFAASPAAAAGLPASVVALANGALQTMNTAKPKILVALGLVLALAGTGVGLFAFQAKSSPGNAPVRLPDDPTAIVLRWQSGAADRGLTLTVRADGKAIVVHPEVGRADAKLSEAELQDLLRFALRDHAFFSLDSGRLEDDIRAAAARKGEPGRREPTVSRLHIRADGREHEVRCAGLGQALARQLPDLEALAHWWAIRQRLERLETWIQAGGNEGVSAAVTLANDRLRQQLPDAPLLTPNDLQSVRLLGGEGRELVLERRGIAQDDPFTFVYARIERPARGEPQVVVKGHLGPQPAAAVPTKPYHQRVIDVEPKPIADDQAVKYDYDMVYVRAPRKGDQPTQWADVARPIRMEPGADLMLLHPDGREEVLVKVAAHESIADPFVSFDGQSVYYAKFHDLNQQQGSDIYKIHVPTRRIEQLTRQDWTPNLRGPKEAPQPVYNLGPCPLPGGKLAFTSSRNGFVAVKHSQPNLQLFVMEEDGSNIECIAPMNLGMALHPVILKDGRLMFSSMESQGVRSSLEWGIWSIHPDGTNWGPMLSAFRTNSFHFQTQLADGSIVVEEYYNANNFGFGSYHIFPVQPPAGQTAFGSAAAQDPGNPMLLPSGRLPFSPYGIRTLTLFAPTEDAHSRPADPGNPKSPRAGKVCHPCGAPDNHLLTVWSPGPVNNQYGPHLPMVDGGIYLIKSGQTVEEPGQMRLIKNDPNYNEQWPRALVPYHRIYGIDEPPRLPSLRNDGKSCQHLPAGTPYGLVGTSSLYKRDSYPGGIVPAGSVTASYPGGKDPWRGLDAFYSFAGQLRSSNWRHQGGDAGLYKNAEIHAIRILALEPTSRNLGGRHFNHANERLRILGEIPVRKFSRGPKGSVQPLDPDGNPDTSFEALIPADVAFTFQTLDKNNMVLNMAQTWHQVRPGERRNDCGGCHAHSQAPTLFQDTAAAKPNYPVFNLTNQTPLLTSKANDRSGRQWDEQDETGLRYVQGVQNVEFHRDIQPILDRSCVACHSGDKPAGGLVLDDRTIIPAQHHATMARVPGSYARLAMDRAGKYGPKPLSQQGYGDLSASRYVRVFQSRRSLLAWKVHGKRLDGWSNDDFPTETVPGDPSTLQLKGQPVPNTPENRNNADLDYVGSAMPPPEAVAGAYTGPDGRKIKVEALTDEDRRTIVRWIDLGCPIDLSFDPKNPAARLAGGWLHDDQRPTLTLTDPKPGLNESVTRLLVGMHDYGSGLDLDSFQVVPDFGLDVKNLDAAFQPDQNLAGRFKPVADGIWEYRLPIPLKDLSRAKLTVTIKDKQGNQSRIERMFSVGK